MMNIRPGLTVLMVTLLVCGLASVGVADISNTAMLFLRIAPGARAAGMGEAFVAVADDATATHYNPAGLGAAPLADTWIRMTPPPEFRPIREMAAQRKASRGGHEAYDLWVLSEGGLVRYDGKRWHTAEVFSTRTNQTVRDIISSYFNVSEEARLNDIIRQVAVANFGVSYDELEQWRSTVLEHLPEGFDKGDELTTQLDSLLTAYMECRLDRGRLERFVKEVREAYRDSALTTDELDRLDILVGRARTRFLPEDLTVPYSAVFTGRVTTLRASDDILMVGTEDGLFHYSGRRWRRFTTDDGLPSNIVTALYPLGKKFLVGTEAGLVVFNGSGLDTLVAAEPLPDTPVEAVVGTSLDDIYVVTGHDLYHYDGATWSNSFEYTVQTETTPDEIARRFTIFGSPTEIRYYVEKLTKVTARGVLVESGLGGDGLSTAAVFEPGQKVRVPYTAGFKGRVNAMYVRPGGELLLATEHGVLRFTGAEWDTPGYAEITVEEGQTLDDIVAMRRLASIEANQQYAQTLRLLNDLETAGLQPGTVIKVYRHPAAAPTRAIAYRGPDYLFATDDGLLTFDGVEWARADMLDLGNEPVVAIVSNDDATWYVTRNDILVRSGGRTEFSLMHVNWLPALADDLYYDFGALVTNWEGIGTVGLSFTYISYGDIIRVDEFQKILGTFASYEFAGAVSFGTSLTSRLKGGVSAKVAYSRLSPQGAGKEQGEGTATVFALDAGLLYHATPRLNLGLALTNVGPKVVYIDAAQADDLPRNLSVGFAYRVIQTEYNTLLVTGEANKILVGMDDGLSNEFKEIIYNAGFEFTYANLFAARAGYIYDQEGQVKAFTVGAGLRLFDLAQMDFAYIPSQSDIALANTLRMSLTIRP